MVKLFLRYMSPLTLWWMATTDGGHDIRQKSHSSFCQNELFCDGCLLFTSLITEKFVTHNKIWAFSYEKWCINKLLFCLNAEYCFIKNHLLIFIIALFLKKNCLDLSLIDIEWLCVIITQAVSSFLRFCKRCNRWLTNCFFGSVF